MWLTFSLCKKQRSPAPRRRPTFRPALEALEGRWQPSALTLTVNSLGDSGTGTGTTGDLRYCINLANQNHNTSSTPDVIDASGVSGTVTLQQGELLISDPNLIINGPGANNLVISPSSYSDGGPTYYNSRVFEVSAGAQVQLSGMTIENGSGIGPNSAWDGDGGGILNFGTLTVSGSTIFDNVPDISATYHTNGGGIYNAGTLTVSSCAIWGNSVGAWVVSGYGGGIYNAGTLTVSNSTVTNNAAQNFGGGIYNDGGTATVNNNSLLKGNSAIVGDGGGIANRGGTLTVSSSTLDQNTAGYFVSDVSYSGDGGAIYNGHGGTLTVSNSTLESNTAYCGLTFDNAYGRGGAIYNDGLMTLSGSTVSDNSTFAGAIISKAYSLGGGIYNDTDGNLTIESQSSVVNNRAVTGPNLFNNHGTVKISKDSVVGK
jgi:hypothetical protein